MTKSGGLTKHQKAHNCNYMGTGPNTWYNEKTWGYLRCNAKPPSKVIFYEHTFAAEFPCPNNVKHIMLMRSDYWTWKLHTAGKRPTWQGLSLSRRCDELLADPPHGLINFVLGRHEHAVASTEELNAAMRRVSHFDLIVITERLSNTSLHGAIQNVTGIHIVNTDVHRNAHSRPPERKSYSYSGRETSRPSYDVPSDCRDRFLADRALDLKLHAHIVA